MRCRLTIRSGESVQVHFLSPGQEYVLGRGQDVSFRLEGQTISRRHAVIEVLSEGVHVTDLSSANGTFIDGVRLGKQRRIPLANEALLSIGDHELLVETQEARLANERFHANFIRALLPSDEFEVLGRLGRGASGSVWAARQECLSRTVAIKVLRWELESGSEEYGRFLREGRICGQVQSPYVVKLHDFRVIQDRPILVMEYVPGPSALERLREGPISISRVLKIGEHVAWALDAAERSGVVHRDVKPHNVLLSPSGIAKLGDFGIAKSIEDTPITGPGYGLGTLSYVAPEQAWEARGADSRSDLYSLGATLYHLICDRPPFVEEEQGAPARLLAKIANDPPPPPQLLRRDCPRPLAGLILRLLEKDPRDRFQSAAEVAEELAALTKLYRDQASMHQTHHDLSALEETGRS